jgi:hypothetical protein
MAGGAIAKLSTLTPRQWLGLRLLSPPPTARAAAQAETLLSGADGVAAKTGTQLEFHFVKGLGSAPKPVYPPNNGFLGSSGTATLVPGARIDRFGSDFGRFVSPEGTPFIQRSLPSSSASAPYSAFEVVKPFEVQAGEIAPWFGMPGRGVQYQLSTPVSQLIKDGYLRPVLRVNP